MRLKNSDLLAAGQTLCFVSNSGFKACLTIWSGFKRRQRPWCCAPLLPPLCSFRKNVAGAGIEPTVARLMRPPCKPFHSPAVFAGSVSATGFIICISERSAANAASLVPAPVPRCLPRIKQYCRQPSFIVHVASAMYLSRFVNLSTHCGYKILKNCF